MRLYICGCAKSCPYSRTCFRCKRRMDDWGIYLEKGTSNGVITDINGQYSISTSSAQPTLVISYIGYKTQEVRIRKKECC